MTALTSWDHELYERAFLGYCLRELQSSTLTEVLSFADETWFTEQNYRDLYSAIVQLVLEESRHSVQILSPERVATLAAKTRLQPLGWAEDAVADCLATDARLFVASPVVLRTAIVEPWRIARGRPAVRQAINELALALDLEQPTVDLPDRVERLLATASTAWSNAIHQVDHTVGLTEAQFIAQALEPVDDTKPHFIPTGLRVFDGFFQGGIATQYSVITGKLVTLAARPSIGKTAVMAALAHGTAESGGEVAVFSLEVTCSQILARLYCIHDYKAQTAAGALINPLSPGNFIRRSFTTDQRQRVHSYCGTVTDGIHLLDDVYALSHLLSRIRLLKRQRPGLALACIDHLGYIVLPKSENRSLALGEATRALKQLAKELKIDILLLCQLNRSIETRNDKRPMLSDLRESGRIEEDSDIVIGLHRDIMGERPEEMQAIGLKVRDGAVGTGLLQFHMRYGVVTNAMP